jgi:hypothetical protein
MIDKSSNPNLLEDTQVEVNPYEITDKIWNLIEPYFTDKYNVRLTEAFPTESVDRPTIVALIQKRTPGREGSKIHGKGHNFVRFLKKTPDGYLHELHVQQQELTIEYSVYANSTAEVKRIAWDLERAVLETVGILQKQIEGFQLTFDQQTLDSSMLWRQQDELIKRTIRFKALLPVQFTQTVPELRYIEIIDSWGPATVSGAVFTRSSSEKAFYISVRDGQRVVNVQNVFVKNTSYPYDWITLIKGTDVLIRRDSNNTVYFEWNDDYGKTPAIGDQFKVDYDLAQLVKGSTIKPQ